MEEKSLPRQIAASGYPPDVVPFTQIEALADTYAIMLGIAHLVPMPAPHLAAWGVALGVITRKQAAEAIREAREIATCPTQRLVELARLLAPAFAAGANFQILAVSLKDSLPPPANVDDETWLLAKQIVYALTNDDQRTADVTAAALRAAAAVRDERLTMADVWELVARARRMNAAEPGLAFYDFVYVIERHRLLGEARPALAAAYAAAIERAPKCPEPSMN